MYFGPDNKPADNGPSRKDREVFCPRCSERAHLFIDIVDPRTGKIYRVYRCRCGQIVWK